MKSMELLAEQGELWGVSVDPYPNHLLPPTDHISHILQTQIAKNNLNICAIHVGLWHIF